VFYGELNDNAFLVVEISSCSVQVETCPTGLKSLPIGHLLVFQSTKCVSREPLTVVDQMSIWDGRWHWFSCGT